MKGKSTAAWAVACRIRMQSENCALSQQIDCSRNGTYASQSDKCSQRLGTGAARIMTYCVRREGPLSTASNLTASQLLDDILYDTTLTGSTSCNDVSQCLTQSDCEMNAETAHTNLMTPHIEQTIMPLCQTFTSDRQRSYESLVHVGSCFQGTLPVSCDSLTKSAQCVNPHRARANFHDVSSLLGAELHWLQKGEQFQVLSMNDYLGTVQQVSNLCACPTSARVDCICSSGGAAGRQQVVSQMLV